MKPSVYKIFIVIAFAFFFSQFNIAQAQYCTNNLYQYGCSSGAYINDVNVGSINQTNTGCADSSGYSDYTSLVADFEQGSIYALTLTTGDFWQSVEMWIDFNDDYVFDSTEKLIGGLPCFGSFSTYSQNFLIPSTAPLGNHRMRLRSADFFLDDFDACSELGLGEVEDYTANIVPATDMAYVSSTTTQNETSAVGPGNINVVIIGIKVVTSGTLNPISVTSFTLNSNGCTAFVDDVTNVKVYYTGTIPSFYSNDSLFGSATDLSSPITGSMQLSQDTNYFWVTYDVSLNAVLNDYLDAECTSITINSTEYTPTVTAPAGNIQIQYCVPVDEYGCYLAYIDGIKLSTLSNTFSYCNGNPYGYINYPATGNLTTSLQQGNSYPLYVSGSTYMEEGFGVWMDLNNDGDFDDSSEFLFSSPDTALGWQTGYITIPSTVSPGDYRMRVRCKAGDTISANECCTTFLYGETEDYTITILPSECFAGFTLYPDSLIPHHYWAINQATGTPPLSYLWSWGDGTADTTAYPSHTYDSAGFYTICLTIADSSGCSSFYCSTYDVQKLSSAEAVNTIITVNVVDSIPDIATTVQNTSVLQSWSVFPNPASSNVFVNYSLAASAKVNIELFDVLGNKLQELSNDLNAGEHHSVIDAQKLSNGIYYLKIAAGDKTVSQKLVVMK